MKHYVDLEFTDFTNPRILSLGLVSEDGGELYVETECKSTMARASGFCQDIVLPQFGLYEAKKAMSSKDFGRMLLEYLAARDPEEPVLCADFIGDRLLLDRAIHLASVAPKGIPKPSWVIAEFLSKDEHLKDVWAQHFDAEERASGLLRHHALLDARVLKKVWESPEHLGHSASFPV